jgi:hypothetical protein
MVQANEERQRSRIDVQRLDRQLGAICHEEGPNRLAMRRPKRRAEDIIIGLDSFRVRRFPLRGNPQLMHEDVLRLDLMIRDVVSALGCYPSTPPWEAILSSRQFTSCTWHRRSNNRDGKAVQTSARNMSITR